MCVCVCVCVCVCACVRARARGGRELELLSGKFVTLMIPFSSKFHLKQILLNAFMATSFHHFTIITLGNRTRVAFYEVGMWDENIKTNLSQYRGTYFVGRNTRNSNFMENYLSGNKRFFLFLA